MIGYNFFTATKSYIQFTIERLWQEPSPQEKYNRALKKWGKGEELGKGAYGTVWHASPDPTTQAPRVIKEQFLSGQPEVYADLAEKESSVLQAISKWPYTPHTVRLLNEAKEERKRRAYLLENGGSNLYERYLSKGKSSATLEEITSITKQALECLTILHEKIFHGDIKPENLLITPEGYLRVADFGLACDKRGTSDIIYSDPYRPPENWEPQEKRHTGPAGDIWALAMTIYELVTGLLLIPAEISEQKRILLYQDKLQLEGLPQTGKRSLRKRKITTFDEEIRNVLGHKKEQVESLIDLLRKMLTFHPKERWTAAEALQHPFFTRFSDDLALKIDHDPRSPPITMLIQDKDNPNNQWTIRLPNLQSCFHLKKAKSFQITLWTENKSQSYETTIQDQSTFIYDRSLSRLCSLSPLPPEDTASSSTEIAPSGKRKLGSFQSS
ncbi:MAG: mitogen-activated protein kinase 1-like protein [uncultured bacterium]|nr:MAG: mitogen-activated protein kinase 1-like protein [uncultured bacterium]OGN58530.1 MAG: hypothetical protein A3C42_03710 [Chlamydiae bacterium RIFCSPHIGHO2_02_FULL_45_9]OGN60753.1 MAG: hypothetical protein A3D96_02415 [Chlamydiae bacterium RIFCSPHIGHO2_12_FULL_44_59]OGN67013.1 MAG: hypothetical protein A2978_02645 [Chlamydiae bacterium RIFCSPLOWO2_01_FULL_44_52]OGN67566.1 MAG: hypothetical protein A3I67_03860 [Chlamydiae bacterium RIFCSPLOWO2_02_FULL_45_22]OGN71267.1 MAG: hypothetical pr